MSDFRRWCWAYLAMTAIVAVAFWLDGRSVPSLGSFLVSFGFATGWTAVRPFQPISDAFRDRAALGKKEPRCDH